MSLAIARKYGRVFAKELGVTGSFGAEGISDFDAQKTFCIFMSDPANQDTATYWNISHQIYMWHSIASIRSLERKIGFGIRPMKIDVDLMVHAYEKGTISGSPKFINNPRQYKV